MIKRRVSGSEYVALRAVLEHPKFARLKVALNINRWQALGLLEALWHFTGRFTPRGDIGKYSNEEIAAWIEYDGDPATLIDALVQSRWLDWDNEHRLIVHDWHSHADDATRLSLKRSESSFIVPTVSGRCRDSVPTVSGLPVPVPVPVPDPVPVPEPEKDIVSNFTKVPREKNQKRTEAPTALPAAATLSSVSSASQRKGPERGLKRIRFKPEDLLGNGKHEPKQPEPDTASELDRQKRALRGES